MSERGLNLLSTLPSFVINTEECLKAKAGDDRKARMGILVCSSYQVESHIDQRKADDSAVGGCSPSLRVVYP